MAQTLFIDIRDGVGPRDFTKFFWERDQFVSHEMNLPQQFQFKVARLPELAGWVAPRRGSFVKFVDTAFDRRHRLTGDGVIFTGYITEEPDPIVIGKAPNGDKQWGYAVNCASEEYIVNIRRLPTTTYVNKTRGFILADLIRKMFQSAVPFNLSSISDGGVEMLYQVDTGKKWSDIAGDFAKADGYTYWVLDGICYYGPQEVATHVGDPLYSLTIGEDDPRWVPYSANIRRVSKDIVNDVTVYGANEPADLVTERFVSDGYQGFHNLAFEPYGLEENKLIEDDFTSGINEDTWELADDGNFIQPFDGALNITGGPGEFTQSTYLRARRPIEMSGVIEFRDGEIYFPPGASGVALVGVLHNGEPIGFGPTPGITFPGIYAGWLIYLNTQSDLYGAIYPIFNGVAGGTSGFVIKKTRHYILRKFLQIDRAYGQAQSYLTASGHESSVPTQYVPQASATFVVEEINNDDDANVFSSTRQVLSATTSDVNDAFLLYDSVIAWSGHFVVNFAKVFRPQQAMVTVNNRISKVGSYLDGGRCELTVDGGRGKLNWYSVKQSNTEEKLDYSTLVRSFLPQYYFKFDEDGTGAEVYDSAGTGRFCQVVLGNYRQDGALGEDGYSLGFVAGAPGTVAYLNPAAVTMTSSFTVSLWFRSTVASTDLQILWAHSLGDPTVGKAIFYQSTLVGIFTGPPNPSVTLYSTRTGLNDGGWHNVVWTQNGSQMTLYVDGLAAASAVASLPPESGIVTFGNTFFVGGSTGTFTGGMDEVFYTEQPLTAEQVSELYYKGLTIISSLVTVPKSGSLVEIAYYRKRASRARVRNQESIDAESGLFNDDGVRQKIIRADDINPTPRNSDECLALAQAYLLDSADSKFEGSYSFETVVGTPTELRIWPMPGDAVRCQVALPDSEIDEWVILNNVNSKFLGTGAYEFNIAFGPVSRYDSVLRQLLLKRKTSLDDPIIKDSEADELATIVEGLPYPPNITNYSYDDVTNLQVLISVPSLPAGVIGIEVRTDDTGWGEPNYKARFTSTFNMTRNKRDHTLFLRGFNAAGLYSRQSTVIRVFYPLQNTVVMSGATAIKTPTAVTFVVPLPKDPDFAGVVINVNRGFSTQAVFKGDGATNLIELTGTEVSLSSNYMTITIPGLADTNSFFVNTYNLLGLTGTAQTVDVTFANDPAPSDRIVTGAGSPEGVVTAIPGTIYLRTDGGTNTTLYVKESGTGNTGWRAV